MLSCRKSIYSIAMLCAVAFTACQQPNNDTIAKQLGNDFKDSIAKYNAKKFDYNFDPLTPQESYFVGSKLKFLKYTNGPELGTIESTLYFDLKTDSVSKIIRRKVNEELNEVGTDLSGKVNDTLYITTFNPKRTLVYADNLVIDSIGKSIPFADDTEWAYKVKYYTEKQYSKRKK